MIEETAALIRAGKALSLAGDEVLLAQLPKGNWIAGTIPYFIGEEGGVETKEKVFVTEPAGDSVRTEIKTYTVDTIRNIAKDAPENGYTVVILPAMTPIHAEYANHARDYENMFIKPVVGWIAGVHLSDLGKSVPKVFSGAAGGALGDVAVALHVTLPGDKLATLHILNLFRRRQDQARSRAPAGGGLQRRPYQHLVPGSQPGNRGSAFLCSGLPGHRIPVGDYVREFNALATGTGTHQHIQFSCNCILN